MKFIWLFVLCFVSCQGARMRTSNRESRFKKARILRPRGEGLENLFNVYDPSFLAVVWPKITNGVHLFLEPRCWQDLTVFFKDLADGRSWAYSVVDASGRYEGAIFAGNTYWLGSKAECLQLDKGFKARDGNGTVDEFQNSDYLNAVLRRERYFQGDAEEWRSLVRRDELLQRLVAADHASPLRLDYTSVQISLNLTKITMAESYGITLGVCLPRSCATDDVQALLTFNIMINDNLKSNKTIPRVVRVLSLRKIDHAFDIQHDTAAVLLILITTLLLIVIAAATIVDIGLIRWKQSNKTRTFDLQKFNNNLDSDRIDERHKCDVIRKEANLDMDSLTIHNINNSNNINLMTKKMKPHVMPSLSLDVVSMERITGSCKRCGKYKKQCNAETFRHAENLPACPRVKSFASITTEPNKRQRILRSLLLCFSLRHSWRRIFNTNMANKDLTVVHLLRVVATFWIIFVHVAVIASYVSDNGGDVNSHNNVYQIVATGTLAFDTFFFVSGLISAHHFFLLKSQYTVEELVSFGGACGQVLQFVCFVTNRAIRMLPAYAYALLLSGALARRATRDSPLALPEADGDNCDAYWWRNLLYITTLFPRDQQEDGDNCDAYWWRNLLYITTLFPRDQQCMQVSWLLSAESQLHAFGALACSLAASGRRLVAALTTAALVVATAADVSAAYAEYGLHMPSAFAAYSTLIERPLGRVTPYFVGVLVGWLVQRLEGRLHVSKVKSSLLWAWSAAAVGAGLALPVVLQSWWTSWLHVLWPMALLWPAVVLASRLAAASRRLLDSSWLAALSRLSYCALLMHGAVARTTLLADTTLCADTLCIWVYAAGVSGATVLAALMLSLLVETPCCSLLRRLSDCAA